MKCQSLFLGKNKEKIFQKMLSAEFAQSVLVKVSFKIEADNFLNVFFFFLNKATFIVFIFHFVCNIYLAENSLEMSSLIVSEN